MRGAVRATLAAWNAIFSPVVVAISRVRNVLVAGVLNEICFCRHSSFCASPPAQCLWLAAQ